MPRYKNFMAKKIDLVEWSDSCTFFYSCSFTANHDHAS